MRSLIQRIKSNTYIFQILTLMSGTLMAQIIMLAFIPILTRLYTPSEFGIYSLFLTLSSMIGTVSSLRYDQAIMLPKSNRDAQALVFLSILLTIAVTLILTIVTIIFYDFFWNYFNQEAFWVWLFPLSVLVFGLVQIFNSYATRKEFYRKIATVKMMESVTTVSSQGISRYFFMWDGLIVGKLLSNSFSLYQLLHYHLKKQTLQLKYLSKRRIRANSKRHESFPKYLSLSTLMNSLSQNIPVLLFSSFFSPAVVGFYSLTTRVLQAPILLIADSTRSVFYQKASKMYANGEDIIPLYTKTTWGLVKLFILPMLIIIFLGPTIFAWFFGEAWRESGVMAQIVIVWFFFAFIAPPTSMIYNILNLQKLLLMIQIVALILRTSGILVGYYFFDSYWVALILFVLFSVVHNLIFIGYIYFKIKKNHFIRSQA